jgi:DNA-binding PadR family transcriptional regulator
MNLDSILLGMLREPASGYELKAAFDQSVNHFWPAELSQIYRTLKRLERGGLLRSRTEPSDRGPDRRIYRLTAAGRKVLHQELAADPEFADERLAYIAQLFFLHELGDLEATRACIEKVREKRARQLASYQSILREQGAAFGASLSEATDEQFHQHLTLDAGIQVTRARVRWCDAALERIDERIRDRKPRATRGRRQRT